MLIDRSNLINWQSRFVIWQIQLCRLTKRFCQLTKPDKNLTSWIVCLGPESGVQPGICEKYVHVNSCEFIWIHKSFGASQPASQNSQPASQPASQLSSQPCSQPAIVHITPLTNFVPLRSRIASVIIAVELKFCALMHKSCASTHKRIRGSQSAACLPTDETNFVDWQKGSVHWQTWKKPSFLDRAPGCRV